MNQFSLYFYLRNPVWIVPLALPIVIYGSQTLRRALLFAVIIAIVVPLTHILWALIERSFPRALRLVPLLVIAALLLTIVEVILNLSGIYVSPRSLVLIRSLSVSGLLLYPAMISARDDLVSSHLRRVAGITIGFLAGFLLFALMRSLFSLALGSFPSTIAGGFFILAFGRIVINLIHEAQRTRGRADR